jgi:hypothetical protein
MGLEEERQEKKPFRADLQQALELRACARGDYLFVMNAYVLFSFLTVYPFPVVNGCFCMAVCAHPSMRFSL